MVEKYREMTEYGTGELVEKKSRFIAQVFPIKSEEEAITQINEIKKKYWDARHNCYAYSVGIEQPILRFSDDGEPSGTAGKPILEVITGEDIHNILVIVTRYFGGVLLGTGGLVRAYQGATKEGIANSRIEEKVYSYEIVMKMEYTELGKVQYLLGERSIPIVDSVYEDKVIVTCHIPCQLFASFCKELNAVAAGKIIPEKKQELYITY